MPCNKSSLYFTRNHVVQSGVPYSVRQTWSRRRLALTWRTYRPTVHAPVEGRTFQKLLSLGTLSCTLHTKVLQTSSIYRAVGSHGCGLPTVQVFNFYLFKDLTYQEIQLFLVASYTCSLPTFCPFSVQTILCTVNITYSYESWPFRQQKV